MPFLRDSLFHAASEAIVKADKNSFVPLTNAEEISLSNKKYRHRKNQALSAAEIALLSGILYVVNDWALHFSPLIVAAGIVFIGSIVLNDTMLRLADMDNAAQHLVERGQRPRCFVPGLLDRVKEESMADRAAYTPRYPEVAIRIQRSPERYRR